MNGPDICVCGHTNSRGKHVDGGKCGAWGCDCKEFIAVWVGAWGAADGRGNIFHERDPRTHTAKLAGFHEKASFCQEARHLCDSLP